MRGIRYRRGWSPRRENDFAGLRAPQGIRTSRGSAPRPPTWGMIFMGLRPIPHLGSFFGKKLPKNPKKPDCIGFRLSSIDSEQGCRRQPCFMHSANCTYSFSDEVKKLKVRSQKNEPRNKTKQARLSSLRSVSIGAALFTSASKT